MPLLNMLAVLVVDSHLEVPRIPGQSNFF